MIQLGLWDDKINEITPTSACVQYKNVVHSRSFFACVFSLPDEEDVNIIS